MVKKYTNELLDKIKEDYLCGIEIHDIAKKYNLSKENLTKKIKAMGIYRYKNRRWTDEEIKILRENYSIKSWDFLLSNLKNWKKEDIIHKASNLKLKRENYYWNEHDIDILIKSYQNKIPINSIYEMLNEKFTLDAISTKAHTLGLIQKRPWSKNEDLLLTNHYSELDMKEICALFPDRSYNSIIQRAVKLGLSYKTTWTQDEVNYLKKHHLDMSDEEIGIHLGRSKDSVRGKRFTEKLYHPIEPGIYNYLSEYIRKRNTKWKQDSAKKCHYKCVITGNRFQAIHHLYGMNIILKETLTDLGYDSNVEFMQLSQNDLDIILSRFFEIQSKYPLGICLCYEIHKQFHDEYGYGDNTPEQFFEFINLHNYKIA